MKKLIYFTGSIVLIGTLIISCKKNNLEKHCDCYNASPWDSTKVYNRKDIVSYDNKCWVANTQGKAKPGPWLQNGNDVWKECQ